MKITTVESALFNPFFTSRMLHYALSGADKNAIKIELIFFILPLIYNPKILAKLASSSIRTKFSNILEGDTKNELVFIDDLIANYRSKTNTAIITLCNVINVGIDGFVKINKNEELSYANEKDSILKQYYKASYNLGSMLSKEDYKNIFLKII